MLKNKWVMIGVLVLAAVVIGTVFVPWVIQRASKGGSRGARRAVPAETAPELAALETGVPAGVPAARPAARERGAVGVSEAPMDAKSWVTAFASANRDTSRSPFQRKNEGLGKVFIRSRPSGAAIYINGMRMPRATDWLIPVSFPAGTYLLELRKEGYEPYITDLVVPEGLADFEQIATVNVALRRKPAAGVREAHRDLLYIQGQPKITICMIMFNESQSWAVVQQWPPSAGRKWVVKEGDEIEVGGDDDSTEVREKIKIVKISPESVTVRNLLINLDYSYGVGSPWRSLSEAGISEKS
ncbi:PEGA domain-containing protein [bacterium]|nr:PEGA domain-containing protein [bacterium]